MANNADTTQGFYETLTLLEKQYWHKFVALFQLVDPKKPEKGCKALILKARKLALEKKNSLEEELGYIYCAAEERTLRRVALFGRCKALKDHETIE